MAVRSYRDLIVWQTALELVVDSYRLCRTLPPSERYGISAQIQRSAVSVPANIAEGCSRRHTGEFANHVSIAKGSLAELETLLLITQELGYVVESELAPTLERADRVSRMLMGLAKKLDKRARVQPRH